MLAHVGAMLGHFWQQDGCQDHHLGDQERQNEPTWHQRGCKIEPRWHPGLRIRGLEGSGEVLGSLGGHFERYWLEVGLSWLMLELCCGISGSKMAAKMAILAIKSAKMAPKRRPNGAKMASWARAS